MNLVVLRGNLGADPEVRHLDGDKVVANMSLATTKKFTNKQNQQVSETQWHKLKVWDGLAKVAENYLRKGSSILVRGELKYDQWDDEQGNKRTTAKIRVLSLEMLGGKPENDQPRSQQTVQQDRPSSDPVADSMEEDDDLPF